MIGPFRDPFLRPGVADEIEAQLQMQEERRVEAARLAKVEAEIARLSLRVRRGILAVVILAVVITVVAARFLTDGFRHWSANPVSPSPAALEQGDSPFSVKPQVRSSKTGPPNSRIPTDTVRDRAPLVGIGPGAIDVVPVSKPSGGGAAHVRRPSPSTATVVPGGNELGSPMAPDRVRGGYSFGDQAYTIIAALMLRFAEHVRWPTGSSTAANGAFTIGILGEDPFGSTLDQAAQGLRIQGLNIVIRRSRDAAALRDARIVFISRSEKAREQETLSSFEGTNVLTLGETDVFTARGGMIEFMIVESHCRFRINSSAVRAAGLVIDGRVLKLAVP